MLTEGYVCAMCGGSNGEITWQAVQDATIEALSKLHGDLQTIIVSHTDHATARCIQDLGHWQGTKGTRAPANARKLHLSTYFR